MKKYLTMWQVWAGIAIALAIGLVTKTDSFSSIFPFALLIICPIMMIFMMKGHKH
ncbi:MAG: DUF2933 domain-containing protein [Patescibacteria group bacterium]